MIDKLRKAAEVANMNKSNDKIRIQKPSLDLVSSRLVNDMQMKFIDDNVFIDFELENTGTGQRLTSRYLKGLKRVYIHDHYESEYVTLALGDMNEKIYDEFVDKIHEVVKEEEE